MIARERELVVRALDLIEAGEQDEGQSLLHDLLTPTYPRCFDCGQRFPSREFLELHQARDCHGLYGGGRWSS